MMDILPLTLLVCAISLTGCVLPPSIPPVPNELEIKNNECRQNDSSSQSIDNTIGSLNGKIDSLIQNSVDLNSETRLLLMKIQEQIKTYESSCSKDYVTVQTQFSSLNEKLERILQQQKLGNCPKTPPCSGKQTPAPPIDPTNNKIEIKCDDGYTLHFVKITPKPHELNIALTEDNAKKFYQQAQRFITSPLYPFVFKAVAEKNGETSRVISEFRIQSEPIDERLYKKIITDGSVNSVSFNDAQKVIETLGKMCPNHQFTLPTEAQFVYLARKIYNPVNSDNNFRKCSELQNETFGKDGEEVKKLLGNQWQLTKSGCDSWSDADDPTRQCASGTFVKKGGTTDSKDATECLPEYRAESTPDVREPNTTLRLILEK